MGRSWARAWYLAAVVAAVAAASMVPSAAAASPASLLGMLFRLAQGHEDGVAAAQVLADHAADYNIDPAAIMAVGDDLGAAVALDLAYLPGQFGPSDVPIAGVATGDGFTLGTPDPGEPPVLDVNGDGNGTAAYMRSVC